MKKFAFLRTNNLTKAYTDSYYTEKGVDSYMLSYLPHFFMASATPQGFFSLFDNLYYPKDEWFCYILKGGPGTGKSTIMKKIAENAQKLGIDTELIHCSSDPDSLDAVIFPKLKKCVADGTAPHILDPIYPGISDKIINLGNCWNEKKLQKNKLKLIDLFEKNKNFHKTASLFLRKIEDIQKSKNNLIEQYIDTKKLEKSFEKIFKSTFKDVTTTKTTKSHENLRFLDATTPIGHRFFSETVSSYAENIYIIEDRYDLVANKILQKLREKIIEKNIEIISCPHALDPKNRLRAILIPSIKTAFVAKNPKTEKFLSIEEKNHKKISTAKFWDLTALKLHKNIINFYDKIIFEFYEEAVANLDKALKTHQEIEKAYSLAMNYQKTEKIADKLISAIVK